MADNNLQIWCWNDNKTVLKKSGVKFNVFEITPYREYAISGSALVFITSSKPIKKIELMWNVNGMPKGKKKPRTILEKGAHSFKCKEIVFNGTEAYGITAAVRPRYTYSTLEHQSNPVLSIQKIDVLYQDGTTDEINIDVVKYERPNNEDIKKLETRNKLSGASLWIFLAIILLILIVVAVTTSEPKKNKHNGYDDVFEKDPNTWTENEKEYVDDFFNRLD